MERKARYSELVRKVIFLISESIRNVDYVNSLYWVLGYTVEDVPEQARLTAMLSEQYEEFQRLYAQVKAAEKSGKNPRVLNIEERIAGCQKIVQVTQKNKELWKNGPLKIRCSDEKMGALALQVKNEGYVILTMSEFERYFDASNAFKFWNRIPDYNMFVIGGGISIASSEFDLFNDMCRSYNEAVKNNQDIHKYKKKLEQMDADPGAYGEKLRLHLFLCRQTLISAFLLVEAFINSIASASLADNTKNYTDEQRLFLQERVRDKNGQEKQRFVSLENKLFEWIKIISSTGRTFDRGNKPFQDFMKVKEYRDAMVHMSAEKVKSFRDINFEVASKAVNVAIEMVKKISEYIAPAPDNVEYPFWLSEKRADGLFEMPDKFEFELKNPQNAKRQ